MKNCRALIIGIVLALFGGILMGTRIVKNEPIETIVERVDTLFVRDTITVQKPLYLTKRTVDSVLVPVTDTVKLRDTLFVYLEREQIRWEDSLSVVYASGIRPQIDSVTHFRKETVITKQIPVVQLKKTRWGIGVSAGYGIGEGGLSPYVGVGLTYNLLTW